MIRKVYVPLIAYEWDSADDKDELTDGSQGMFIYFDSYDVARARFPDCNIMEISVFFPYLN